jgi:aminoacyl-tRNA hydrolase
VALARCWRPWLAKPTVVAITGSAGKTTTKELLAGILASRGKGTFTPDTFNRLRNIAQTILRTKRSHDFCIVELSENEPGVMAPQTRLLKPSVAIVTVVGDDHRTAFENSDGPAQEMSALVAVLPETGTTILNADDPRVLAMAAASKARVVTYGRSLSATLRAEDISSNWPNRLSMTVVHHGHRQPVQTQLCGTHWAPSVLGAIAGAMSCGMSLDECASAIACIPPQEGRMQPVTTSEGVTFIRDDFKAPLWTLEGCFDFLRAAVAPRKVMVIGTLSDHGAGSTSQKYLAVARVAKTVADLTIFVGPWAASALKANGGATSGGLVVAFSGVKQASDSLRKQLQPGDLVLLKGTNKQDHLVRLILAQDRGVNCWRDNCRKFAFCNTCNERMKRSSSNITLPMPQPLAEVGRPVTAKSKIDHAGDITFVVGLGNPGVLFHNTPHNVGYAVVDRITGNIGATWDQIDDVQFAKGVWREASVCLVKVQSSINATGPSLRRYLETVAAAPDQCVLVFDDLNLRFGSVKVRQRGSAGGHRGVASILEAFQTDAFRRVKIGVASPESDIDKLQYVLTPLSGAALDELVQSYDLAVQRLAEMLVTVRDGGSAGGAHDASSSSKRH